MSKMKKNLILEDEFNFLLNESALNKNDFLLLIDCSKQNFYNWQKKNAYPFYTKIILNLLIRVNNLKENYSEKLSLLGENRKLKKTIDSIKNKENNTHYVKSEFIDNFHSFSKIETKLTRIEFENKLKKAGFKSGAEFAEKLGILRANVTEWHKMGYPKYVEPILKLAIKANMAMSLDKEIEFYKKENLTLSKKIFEIKTMIENNLSSIEMIEEDNNELNKDDLKTLMKDCGFETYIDLAQFIHINSKLIISWNTKNKYPKYLKQLLKWYAYIKSHKNTIEDLDILELNNLEKENEKLEKELEVLKSIKDIMKEKVKVIK